MKVKDHFSDVADYQELLAAAVDMARGDWEQTFTRDMEQKFEQHGAEAYLSEKQLGILTRIQTGARS